MEDQSPTELGPAIPIDFDKENAACSLKLLLSDGSVCTVDVGVVSVQRQPLSSEESDEQGGNLFRYDVNFAATVNVTPPSSGGSEGRSNG